MQINFPLKDVTIEFTKNQKEVNKPLFSKDNYRCNQNEFSIDIEGVAIYYVREGKSIYVTPYKNAEPKSIALFLNNWGLVSILHQRKKLNFHASSFGLEGKGIMICGDSGAGKSSLTAAFSFKEAQFISDDVTTIEFKNNLPLLFPLPNLIALKEKTISQLELKHIQPDLLNPLNNKKLYSLPQMENTSFPLTHVIWLSVHDNKEIEITDLNPLERFTMLRGEICGWELLNGMPATEKRYMNQLIQISNAIRITKIQRPESYSVPELKEEVFNYLKKEILIAEKN